MFIRLYNTAWFPHQYLKCVLWPLHLYGVSQMSVQSTKVESRQPDFSCLRRFTFNTKRIQFNILGVEPHYLYLWWICPQQWCCCCVMWLVDNRPAYQHDVHPPGDSLLRIFCSWNQAIFGERVVRTLLWRGSGRVVASQPKVCGLDRQPLWPCRSVLEHDHEYIQLLLIQRPR